MYYHGGGYAFGNLDSHDEIVRKLCVRSGFLIVSVDYRSALACTIPACRKMLSQAQRLNGLVGLPWAATAHDPQHAPLREAASLLLALPAGLRPSTSSQLRTGMHMRRSAGSQPMPVTLAVTTAAWLWVGTLQEGTWRLPPVCRRRRREGPTLPSRSACRALESLKSLACSTWLEVRPGSICSALQHVVSDTSSLSEGALQPAPQFADS